VGQKGNVTEQQNLAAHAVRVRKREEGDRVCKECGSMQNVQDVQDVQGIAGVMRGKC